MTSDAKIQLKVVQLEQNSKLLLQNLLYIQIIPFRMIKIVSRKRFFSMKQFDIIEGTKVGCGSFGTVKIARHKNTCRMYAVKIMSLQDMASETELKLIEREIKLHSEMDHPHIIRLWQTLLEDENIYMIMEYAEKGNLFYHQNTKNIFSQFQAFKYFMQVLQAVNFLHNNNIIHRDLKPQNILLDSLNNIKLCDFGWCAEDIKAKRSTFCGTYEYMAPQMVFKGQYDYRVDIWAIGVLLYEMLHGCAPFKGKSTEEIQQSMVKGSFQVESNLSSEATNLILNILQFSPDKRLSIQKIFHHPWVLGMENRINNYLNKQKVIFPKQIHQKISFLPLKEQSSKLKLTDSLKHRKNNSMNVLDFSESFCKDNDDIINVSSIKSKQAKNNYHSLQKDKQYNNQDNTAFAKGFEKQEASFKRLKYQCNKFTLSGAKIQTHKTFEKCRNSKENMHPKQLSIQRQKMLYNHPLSSLNKKKNTLRHSQIHEMVDKCPVRFNTQANDKDDWQPSKLKKTNIKSKMMIANSKSGYLKSGKVLNHK